MEKLQPCRYCGTVPNEDAVKHEEIGQYRFWVSCPNPNCWADGPMGRTEREAVKKWNEGVGR